jgi:hypothetical protein
MTSFSYNPTDFIRYVTRMLRTTHNPEQRYICNRSSCQSKHISNNGGWVSFIYCQNFQDQKAKGNKIFECCTYLDKQPVIQKGEAWQGIAEGYPFDRDRFPGFALALVVLTPPTDFFLRMPLRLSDGYSHLMERRWHWLIKKKCRD